MIHPVWVRVTHWINAIAMLVMIGSGWQIYNASPLFGFHLPERDHARRLARRRAAWHFAAMWVLVINGLVYVALGLDHRPLPPQAAADPPERGDRRHQGGADVQALA